MWSNGFVPARSIRTTCRRGPLEPALVVVALALMLAACGGDSSLRSRTDAAVPRGWKGVLDQARGQTVRFWMYGGDERVNAYVDDEIGPALDRLGVRLRRVPVSDTADAVRRVVAERRAGRTAGGGVDLLWINGENFASGKQAGLWLRDWSRALPNSRRFVDWDDPSIARDFGVAVDGQESPWQRATFVYAHDRSRVKQPPRSFDALLAYAKAHPGRVTYPAPPDFTGSAFVRQVVADKGEYGAFAYLRELNPYLYRAGEVFPKSQAELEQLFGDGLVDFAMAYDANFVNAAVRKGMFAPTARPFLVGSGALTNASYVTIPANAAHVAGAKVLANVLLEPRLQARKAEPAVLGNPTVLDVSRLGSRRGLFSRDADDRSPYLLTSLGAPVGEFAAADVAPLEQRWRREVLR